MAEYIERTAALALVRPDAPEDEKAAVTIATAKKLVRSIVRRTLAADVAPVVHGRWEIDDGANHCHCTNCFFGRNIETQICWRYCPNCGASMDYKE